jgi:hypothetical protein
VNKKKIISFFVILLVSGLNYLVFAAQNENKKQEIKEEKYLKLWIGYNGYNMEEFNNKLRNENNTPVNSGFGLGVELNLIEFSPGAWIKIGAPFGIEYFNAESKTDYSYSGGSTTVDWKLPVCGIYLAPELLFSKIRGFYLRPLGVGYYTLGKVISSRLIITDRPGRLEASSVAFGVFISMGMKYTIENIDLFAEGGYRRLEFTNIFLDPKGDFRESQEGPLVQPGYMKESLDYSGLILKIGIRVTLK